MIIMFAGKAGAGKDTSAEIVREIFPNAEMCFFAKKVSKHYLRNEFLCGKIDNVLTIMQLGEGDTPDCLFCRKTVL